MLRNLAILALAGTAALAAQQPRMPQFPQHSTGWPAVGAPPVGHIPALSNTIQGRPVLSYPGARPINPRPVFIGGPVGGWYNNAPAAQPIIIMTPPQAAVPASASNSVVVVNNPDYKPEVAKPVMREYFAESKPYENFQPAGGPAKPKVFLLALKDGSLRQAVAFWREGDTLHFVLPDHKQESIAYAKIDVESSRRFNQERGIEIKLD